MKKWQEWTIAIIVMVVVAGVIGGAYWYLTKEGTTIEDTVVVVSQEERDLADAGTDLKGIDDLDLTALETIEKDLQAIDLSSL